MTHVKALLCSLLLTAAALEASASTGSDLVVMTYNVNFGLSGDRASLRAIADAGADIVLLQETNRGWERAIRRRLSAKYPHILFEHHRAAGGLGILSKYPIEERRLLVAPTGWFPAWRLVVRAPRGLVQLLNVHLRPPISDSGSWVSGYFTTGGHRLRELRHYLRFLDAALPTLIAGDFNEARGPAIELLADRGMHSALHEYAPDAITWHWRTRIGELTNRLDNVFYSGGLDATAARVMTAGNSDHYPVVVRFRQGRPRAGYGLE